jgi:ketosteroid isomerase-like protein
MSREIEALRRVYDAFNRRDLEEFLAGFDPDAEVRPLIGSIEGRVYRGHAGLRRWWTDALPETWAEIEAHPEEFIDSGDVMLVLVRNVGRGASSGARVEQHVAHVVRMREGKVAELTSYADRTEAFRAVGVSRPGTG